MKVLIDACVLYPTVVREVLLKSAAAGVFTPLWSARILEEWRRAAARLNPVAAAQAEAEIALVKARWPEAEVDPKPSDEARLYLPDENDVHVLASAIAGSADVLLTVNIKDFPRGTLYEEGIRRDEPDHFLTSHFVQQPEVVKAAVAEVWDRAKTMEGCPPNQRALLRKARLPRLAKALTNLEY
ncbi:RSP_2648 family PIN domain-containing protein [Shimia ponticola]|uniref:RSP_2648 family PIN domain-containing protein n=1 Tax=Shimia ponticola TaxID=2582893 RepID=UPI0011BE392C|nr:PIN domain-containing protein [Shimia ponticola]